MLARGIRAILFATPSHDISRSANPLIFASKRWNQSAIEHVGKQTVRRIPVVTIMGHVDHGKTTLLDNLRNSQIVKQEFGGITQHIGAFVVPFKQRDKTELVTFLDTPGHAAFAAMRQRGADVTDIVVLVVACEDGVMDQTVESINYAKNAGKPVIVAVNKIDKFTDERSLRKSIDMIQQQLNVHDLVCEERGGDVQMVKMSALAGIGVEDLKEAILAQAETLELKTEIDCRVGGRVIESRIDPHRGKLCTVLVQQGQLRKGDILIAGTNNWAKVRALFDERNQLKQVCDPGMPIQVTGWRGERLPAAGDPVAQVETESEARSIINKFMEERKHQKAVEDAEVARKRAEEFHKLYREKFLEKKSKYHSVRFTPRGFKPKESALPEDWDKKINLILKCDVDGSLDALLDVLDTYDKDNRQLIKLDLVHYGVGDVTDGDYVLAASFPNSVIYGFNVKSTNQKIFVRAKQDGIPLKFFNVIYHLVDDLKERLAEKLPELEQEDEIGRASVIQEFIVTDLSKRKSRVAGCHCNRGLLRRDSLYKLLRNNEILAKDLEVKSLKHLKDDVKEIAKGRDCGISFTALPEDIEFKMGDLLIAYEKKKYKPKLRWEIKGFGH